MRYHKIMRGLIFGCLFGMSSVIFGAILTHALGDILNQKELKTLDVASKYLFYVSVPLLILHISQANWHWPKSLYNLFIISCLLFSGSLILLIFTNVRWFGFITPIGGILLMSSWVYFLFLGYKNKPSSNIHYTEKESSF
jgi:uncharacterized membrane protein YgdD (TMEM256/DUF423 family)